MKKVVGSILMILGTSIGAGMLALPIISAHESFVMTLLLLVAAWLLMTIGAFSLLEVNLWASPNSNMISMADQSIGRIGKAFTWFIYLLLLYSLICAYLSGLSDIIQQLLANIHINIPRWTATLLGLTLFGAIVYRGISSVDMVNRGLMSIKLIAYVVLVVLITPHIHLGHELQGDYLWHNDAFTIMLTSFGYAIIIPSLRGYLGGDKKQLQKVVLIGSLLPLLIYTIWIFVVQGLMARSGHHGLIQMIHSQHTTSLLMQGISNLLNTAWLSTLVKVFISICAITSFLGVSICLTDFIADGFKVEKRGKSGLLVYGLTFLPPLLIVLLYPGVFIYALNYAGIWCLLLLVIIPLMMLYKGRYQHKLPILKVLPFSKNVVLTTLLVSIALVITDLI